ncbi:hypothetical protein [Pseudomonas chlororaphis]|uniref:hypothetical protein n=1 Tax=Pseudomonas chlororaphis TaxID=587753 RepID=UPI0012DA9415|nr:hypothetical protein [Pseudomonas chlororaphis]
MPGKITLRFVLTVILPWLIWGATLLACGLVILLPKVSPQDHREYYTTVHNDRGDTTAAHDTMDYVIVNPRSITLTIRAQPRDGFSQNKVIYSNIVKTDGTGGQLEVKSVHASEPEPTAQKKDSPEAIEQYQYATIPGTILNYEVLTGHMVDALCLYIYELNRLRCFGR